MRIGYEVWIKFASNLHPTCIQSLDKNLMHTIDPIFLIEEFLDQLFVEWQKLPQQPRTHREEENLENLNEAIQPITVVKN